ncbi:Glutaredoxin-C1 [Bienertia sinuspersici]
MGSCYYLLQEVKTYTWYEVKISYPASYLLMLFFSNFCNLSRYYVYHKFIEGVIYITNPCYVLFALKRGVSDVGMNRLKKLLNTEKLIFKAEDLDEINRQGELYVLVTVEPEGSVAIPDVQEKGEYLVQYR